MLSIDFDEDSESRAEKEWTKLISSDDSEVVANQHIDKACLDNTPHGQMELCINGQNYIVKQKLVPGEHQAILNSNIEANLILRGSVQLLSGEISVNEDEEADRLNLIHRDGDIPLQQDIVIHGDELTIGKEELIEIQEVVESEQSQTETETTAFRNGAVSITESCISQVSKSGSANAHVCGFCSKRFQRKNIFLRHLATHTGEKPFACGDCGKRFSQNAHRKVHQRIHRDEKMFACDVCGKKFTVNSNLKTHKRIHSGEKPFRCEVCGMGFSQRSSMTVHKRSHSKEKPFSCEKCGSRFTRLASLRYHQNVHGESDRFQCKVCDKRFASSTYLQRHLNSHNSSKEFVCGLCGKRFSQNSNLKNHLRLHTGERRYQCSVCDERFMHSQSLKIHLREHGISEEEFCKSCGEHVTQSCKAKVHQCKIEEKSYNCDHCRKSFSKASSLKKHAKSHNKNSKFFCEVCGKTYCRNESLLNHMKMHESVSNASFRDSSVVDDTDKEFEKMLSCGTDTQAEATGEPKSCLVITAVNHCVVESRCPRGEAPKEENAIVLRESNYEDIRCVESQGSPQEVTDHEAVKPCDGVSKTGKRFDEAECEMTDSTLTVPVIDEGLAQDRDVRSEVEPLRAACSQSSETDAPVPDDDGKVQVTPEQDANCVSKDFCNSEERFQCSLCGKYFLQQAQLYRHLLSHTGRQKPFTCDICGKRFTQSCHLKVHFRTHSGEKRFTCDVCGKCFAVKSNLKTHMRIHSGEKPYKCGICGAGFSQSTSMKVHRRVHTGEKPFICDVCGRCFTRSENLESHKKAHKGDRPYKCDSCENSFTNRDQLKQHRLCHGKDKQFQCTVCDKKFNWRANLRYHLRCHNEQRAFECELCKKVFKHECSRKVHLKSIHKVTALRGRLSDVSGMASVTHHSGHDGSSKDSFIVLDKEASTDSLK